MVRTGIAIGLNKGFITTPINKQSKKTLKRPSYRKGTLGKRVHAIRSLVGQVCGFAPYEKRILELLKTGTAKDLKKAQKIAKARLGTLKRAKAKKDQLEGILRL